MVDRINFKSNITRTTNNTPVNRAATKGINNFWTNYFNKKPDVAANFEDSKNATLDRLKNKFSPATYQVLQDVDRNFANVSETVARNTKQENLVIDDAYYIPDREYADTEV